MKKMNMVENYIDFQANMFCKEFQPKVVDTEILQMFIIWLVDSHPLTSKDSITNLIYSLEKYKKENL